MHTEYKYAMSHRYVLHVLQLQITQQENKKKKESETKQTLTITQLIEFNHEYCLRVNCFFNFKIKCKLLILCAY